MIVKALLTVFFGISNLITTLLPQGDPPSFLLAASPLLHNAVASANGLSPWIPWSLAATVAGVIFGIWVVLTTVSGVRWLVGWIPTMGGA